MPIYPAQMHSNGGRRGRVISGRHLGVWRFRRSRGFTFIELVVVTVSVGLFAILAQAHLFGLLGKNRFRAQIHEFVSTMRMAAMAASESDRRYEVIIDITEQSFLLREITSPDLSLILEEEIIVDNYFSENCRVAYVEFDDGDFTNEGRAKFRAGNSGWTYGGVIVFVDKDDRPYSVAVNRLSRIIALREGEVELLEPKAKDDVPF